MLSVRFIVRQMKDRFTARARGRPHVLRQRRALLAARTFDVDQGVPFEREELRIRARSSTAPRPDGSSTAALRSAPALDAVNWVQEGMTLDDAGSAPPGMCRDRRDARFISTRRDGDIYAARAFLTSDSADARASSRTPWQRRGARPRAAQSRGPGRDRRAPGRRAQAASAPFTLHGATMAEAAGGFSRSWASRLHARAVDVARSLMRAKITG